MLRGQKQESGDGSSNFQAGNDIVVLNQGLTPAQAMDLAIRLFEQNFLSLVGKAEETARERAEQITKDFLSRLLEDNPKALPSMADPDMQRSLFEAQKGFACSGERDLESMLIDLLVVRAGQEERNLKTITLNEAILTLPRLTQGQRRTLALCLAVNVEPCSELCDLETYYSILQRYLLPYVDGAATGEDDCAHLVFAGAGYMHAAPQSVEKQFSLSSRGFFTCGFSRKDVPPVVRDKLGDPEIFIPCIRDSTKLQLNMVSVYDAQDLGSRKGIEASVLQDLADIGKMEHAEIRDDVLGAVPEAAQLFSVWTGYGMPRLQLTNVGRTIAEAYWFCAEKEPGEP